MVRMCDFYICIFSLFPFCKNTFISGKTLKGREYEKTVRTILLLRQRHRAEFIISMKKKGVEITASRRKKSGQRQWSLCTRAWSESRSPCVYPEASQVCKSRDELSGWMAKEGRSDPLLLSVPMKVANQYRYSCSLNGDINPKKTLQH